MRFDRPEYESAPVGRLQPVTATQKAMMHKSFTQQAQLCDRMGEPKDAARWRKLAEETRQ